MAKSSTTFSKREKEKKRLEKRKEKEQRKEDRKAGKESKSFEDMLAYVDENGNITSTPPDPSKKRIVKESDIELTSRNKGGAGVPELRHGFVKYFDKTKGYGFIKDTQTSEEFFFHYRAADFQIAQQDKVTFDTEMGMKGPNAVRITKFSAAAPAKPEAKPDAEAAS
ncbi:MAG: cold-shock protein [Bacteroidota bacterium]